MLAGFSGLRWVSSHGSRPRASALERDSLFAWIGYQPSSALFRGPGLASGREGSKLGTAPFFTGTGPAFVTCTGGIPVPAPDAMLRDEAGGSSRAATSSASISSAADQFWTSSSYDECVIGLNPRKQSRAEAVRSPTTSQVYTYLMFRASYM